LSAPTSPAIPSRNRWIGPLCAVVGVFGFSFKAILIKLAYKAYPVDAVTLLTLRMLYSAPLFCLMAWWASTMAVVSTALPTWLIAESVRRLGANAASLVGAMGPVFTIGLGAMILGESIHAMQLAGAALVLTGVLLVTLRAKSDATASAV